MKQTNRASPPPSRSAYILLGLIVCCAVFVLRMPVRHSVDAAAQGNPVLFGDGFESGRTDERGWTDGWGIDWIEDFDDVSRVGAPTAFQGQSLRVRYTDVRNSGLLFHSFFDHLDIPRQEEAYLRYYIRFEPGFDFVKGGKLPGLLGGTNTSVSSGGNHPDGTNGWSTRLMWRANGDISVYAYLPKSPNGKYGYDDFGDYLMWDFETPGSPRRFVPGTWHSVEQYVKLNTVGKEDGKIYAWLDGKRALKLDDVTFRTADTKDTKIAGIAFSTFFGGSTPDWAPTKPEYVYFDNVIVSTAYIGQARLLEFFEQQAVVPNRPPSRPVIRHCFGKSCQTR